MDPTPPNDPTTSNEDKGTLRESGSSVPHSYSQAASVPPTEDSTAIVHPPTPTSDSQKGENKSNLPPLAPLQTSTSLDNSQPPITPRTRQLHFSDNPPRTHSYDPTASTSPQPPSVSFPPTPSPRLPSASSSRSTALGLYSPSTPSTPHREIPPPSLPQTVQDLKTLLKSFLVVLPSSLRKLRFLIPQGIRVVARTLIHSVAMVLHARQALASNILYDFVAALWRGVINIFFREIRSRGAWKIPRTTEGATIFVVGPHHNQVSFPLRFFSPQREIRKTLRTEELTLSIIRK